MRNIQLQIVQHLKPGGIETMVLDLMRCAAPGHEVHVVSLENTAAYSLAKWPRLAGYTDRLHFLDKQPGVSIAVIFKLRSLMLRLGVTAVQTHHVGPLLYGGLAARLAGISRLIHTEHDAWHLRDIKRRKLQDGLISLLKPVLVADSHMVASELAKTLPKRQYQVIPNGVDCDLFKPGCPQKARAQFNLPQEVTLIGCAGRMEPVKGHSRLLKAHAQLSKPIHLALAGTGSLEDNLSLLTRQLGTHHLVHFLGHIDDMPTFYQALDVFCLPSDMEGMPLSLLEAQATGIPCVATDVGGMREAMCPHTGIVVPAADCAKLAAGLNLALERSLQVSPRTYSRTHANFRDVVAAYQNLLSPEVT